MALIPLNIPAGQCRNGTLSIARTLAMQISALARGHSPSVDEQRGSVDITGVVRHVSLGR